MNTSGGVAPGTLCGLVAAGEWFIGVRLKDSAWPRCTNALCALVGGSPLLICVSAPSPGTGTGNGAVGAAETA